MRKERMRRQADAGERIILIVVRRKGGSIISSESLWVKKVNSLSHEKA